jgi:D-sedoheptulose 7-phosphate isomerase
MIKEYLRDLSELLENLPERRIEELVQLLQDVRDRGGTVFVFGNGGSATTASHFACDLLKGTARKGEPSFRVMTLHDLATFTAYGNDIGYESVFAEPLKSLGRPGDIAIGISCSGNSENVLQAMDIAHELNMQAVGLTGFQGGKLKNRVDLCIIIPSEDMQHIEDAHQIILHAVFRELLL